MKITEKELAVIRAFGLSEYEGGMELTCSCNWMFSIREHSELSSKSFSGVCASLHEKGLITSDTTGDPNMMDMNIEDTYTMGLTKKGFDVYFEHFSKEYEENLGELPEEYKNHNKTFNILNNKTMKNSKNVVTVEVLNEKIAALITERKGVYAEKKKQTDPESIAFQNSVLKDIRTELIDLREQVLNLKKGKDANPSAKSIAKSAAKKAEKKTAAINAKAITDAAAKKVAKKAAEKKAAEKKKATPIGKLSVNAYLDRILEAGGTWRQLIAKANAHAKKIGNKRRFSQGEFNVHINYRRKRLGQTDFMVGAKITEAGVNVSK